MASLRRAAGRTAGGAHTFALLVLLTFAVLGLHALQAGALDWRLQYYGILHAVTITMR